MLVQNASPHLERLPENVRGIVPWARLKFFRYATVFGAWGDCLCALGNVKDALRRTGQDRCEVLYCGRDPAIPDFLRGQRFVSAVHPCIPESTVEYLDIAHVCVTQRNYPRMWLPRVLRGTGLQVDDVIGGGLASTHISFGFHLDPAYRWHGARLPERARSWARRTVADFGATILVFPRSEQSTDWPHHWPHWDQAIHWLVREGHRIVLCGRGYAHEWQAPNALDLVNRTSMIECFALADACGHVVTTVNGMAHWCMIQQIPAVACANVAIPEPANYFRRMLTVPNISLVEMEDDLETFQRVCDNRFWHVVSETSKHRSLILPYVQGIGIDIGAAGDPVVPWAIAVDMPGGAYGGGGSCYSETRAHLEGDAGRLEWFRDASLDFVFSSHLIEDFDIGDWPALLREWFRVLRPGGHLVIFAPEKNRWKAAVEAGQPPNCSHKEEPFVGQLSEVMKGAMGSRVEVVTDRLCSSKDYGLMAIFRKLS